MIADWLILWLEDSQITGETHFCVGRRGCFCGRLAFEWTYSSLASVIWTLIMQSVECPAGTNGLCLFCSEWTLLPSWSWGPSATALLCAGFQAWSRDTSTVSPGVLACRLQIGAPLSFWSCLGQSMIRFCVISYVIIKAKLCIYLIAWK